MAENTTISNSNYTKLNDRNFSGMLNITQSCARYRRFAVRAPSGCGLVDNSVAGHRGVHQKVNTFTGGWERNRFALQHLTPLRRGNTQATTAASGAPELVCDINSANAFAAGGLFQGSL